MTITPEEIEKLRELEKKATPGPWSASDRSCSECKRTGTSEWSINGPPGGYHDQFGEAADAAFIAAARNILPRLLSAYETEKAAREQERNRFVSGASAERYWEARWRDEKARADRLAKALREIEAFATDEARLEAWDGWRKYIANGGGGSWPRDAYESYMDFFAETARVALTEEPKT